MRKKMLILTVMLVFAFLPVCAWKYARESTATVAEPKKQLPVVSAVAAASGSISRTMELEGTVAPVRIARLSSPVEGPIGLCRVREGDRLTKGREIICIGRNETVNALLAAAQADLIKEKDELDRVIKLVDAGAVQVLANGDHVAYVIENGKAVLRKVETGIESNGAVAILQGVRKAEQVVVAGNETLKNGTEVTLIEEKGDLKEQGQDTGTAATPMEGAAR